MNLVIVESPTKSKTIQKFLGSDYRILSSYGHMRDLPKSELGIDTENNFKPKYIIPLKSKKNVNILKKSAQEASSIILATDEDREGESIAWHLSQILDLNDGKQFQRIVFHEITKPAIENAIKNPREIDLNLVNAQQARRILDRLVGYKLSPFLWKKILRGLSAGRVQSSAVKLICEREEEIKKFIAEEYWTIEALFEKFNALLIKKNNEAISKLGIKSKQEADEIINDLKESEYKVLDLKTKDIKKNPLPPFTTSSLQQEAWKKFNWPAKFTMGVAQKLYEKGITTYHRTDSLNLSDLSLFAAKKFIIANYGKNYWAGFIKKYKTKTKRAQEAHEAIRPSYPDKTPESLKSKLDENQFRLYNFIWQRFIACQMSQAVFNSSTVDIKAKEYTFRTTGQILKFDGFLKIYPVKYKEAELPILEKEQILKLKELSSSQHFTQPPSRYNEASLIKILEENGVGRPSTYASLISVIQERNYVEKNENRKFQPTEMGTKINNLLEKHFPKIVDIKFTAEMEENLDKIAQGQKEWTSTIKEFYEPFENNLEKKYKEIPDKQSILEETDKKCPECQAPIIIRIGRFGKFYACSGFPKCKYTEPLEKSTLGIKCPKCAKGEIVEKRTKKRKIFYACNKFPKCDFALWDKPTGEKCDKCGSLIVETKKGKKCSKCK